MSGSEAGSVFGSEAGSKAGSQAGQHSLMLIGNHTGPAQPSMMSLPRVVGAEGDSFTELASCEIVHNFDVPDAMQDTFERAILGTKRYM